MSKCRQSYSVDLQKHTTKCRRPRLPLPSSLHASFYTSARAGRTRWVSSTAFGCAIPSNPELFQCLAQLDGCALLRNHAVYSGLQGHRAGLRISRAREKDDWNLLGSFNDDSKIVQKAGGSAGIRTNDEIRFKCGHRAKRLRWSVSLSDNVQRRPAVYEEAETSTNDHLFINQQNTCLRNRSRSRHSRTFACLEIIGM